MVKWTAWWKSTSRGGDWFKKFWHGVLTQQSLCQALSNRSLSNWVMIYNNWQADFTGCPALIHFEKCQWNSSCLAGCGQVEWSSTWLHATLLERAPVSMVFCQCSQSSCNAKVLWILPHRTCAQHGDVKLESPRNTYELQEWLAAPLSRVLELVKLFDPSGWDVVPVRIPSKRDVFAGQNCRMLQTLKHVIDSYWFCGWPETWDTTIWKAFPGFGTGMESFAQTTGTPRGFTSARLWQGQHDQGYSGSQQSPRACGTSHFGLQLVAALPLERDVLIKPSTQTEVWSCRTQWQPGKSSNSFLECLIRMTTTPCFWFARTNCGGSLKKCITYHHITIISLYIVKYNILPNDTFIPRVFTIYWIFWIYSPSVCVKSILWKDFLVALFVCKRQSGMTKDAAWRTKSQKAK